VNSSNEAYLKIVRLPHFRFSLRGLLIAFAVIAVVLSYIGSYYRLSRRGIKEQLEYGMVGFLYIPFDEAARTRDLSRHRALVRLYAPLNWLDREFLGGNGPVTGIMWDLAP
jgi:hypothetical protein